MATTSKKPTYNLKAVVQETGLKPDTLRAWERRYGLPQPERTSGGHRIYSEHDIELLKWLMQRQEEGLSISRAVKLWQDLIAEGQQPLLNEAMSPVEPAIVLGDSENIDQMKQVWIDACLAFNEAQAEQLLTQAFALYPVEMVCQKIIASGLAEIGQGWYEGDISVQQEHFASALALRRLDSLISSAPRPTRSQKILVLCAPEDTHTFSPLYISLLLRRRGWPVTYLGADVPVTQLEETIQSTQPDLVIIAAQLLTTAANLLEVAEILTAYPPMVAYGGLIFSVTPELKERIPAYYLGDTFDYIVHFVEKLFDSPVLLPNAKAVSYEYQQAYELYRMRRAQIDAQLWQRAQDGLLDQTHLNNANLHLAQNVLAALKFGNIEFVGPEIEWVRGLTINYQIPIVLLTHYLQAYKQAAVDVLGDEVGADIVIDWLEKLIPATQYI
ncbi:MAG TPA: MerR family transcriptional regulator [Anaerolineae bacterium]|nr:MerR family transcriptional regulator [Anaerolineae bacterium]